MAEIILAVNCAPNDFDAVTARCEEIKSIFIATAVTPPERWVHFDAADAAFTFHKSWDDPQKLATLKLDFAFEAHLMTENPRAAAERWLAAGAKRLIVHLETAPPALFAEIAALAAARGAELTLALNPETPAAMAQPYLGGVQRILILGVHPGLSGQKFLPQVLEKLQVLKHQLPNVKMEVDGGVNPDVAHLAIAAGADALVSGSDVLENPDPIGEYATLRAIK